MNRKETINNKLVTAIITTYKRNVDIVERAVKSVANQTYSNIELLIINDNPNDIELSNEIEQMTKKYNNIKIRYILVDKNGGACKARNIGIKESKGYYIAFLDDDDEWIDIKIEEQVKCFENDNKSNIGIVYCNVIIHNDDTKTNKLRFKKIQSSGNIHHNLLIENPIGSTSFPLFKKNVLEEFNGFREDMPAMQEWELYLRISKKYDCKYIDKPLAIYHKYNGERITNNYKKRELAHRKIEEEFGEEIKKDKNALYLFHISDCNIYSLNKQFKISFRYLMKAIALKPLRIGNNIKIIAKFIVNFFKR